MDIFKFLGTDIFKIGWNALKTCLGGLNGRATYLSPRDHQTSLNLGSNLTTACFFFRNTFVWKKKLRFFGSHDFNEMFRKEISKFLKVMVPSGIKRRGWVEEGNQQYLNMGRKRKSSNVWRLPWGVSVIQTFCFFCLFATPNPLKISQKFYITFRMNDRWHFSFFVPFTFFWNILYM